MCFYHIRVLLHWGIIMRGGMGGCKIWKKFSNKIRQLPGDEEDLTYLDK